MAAFQNHATATGPAAPPRGARGQVAGYYGLGTSSGGMVRLTSALFLSGPFPFVFRFPWIAGPFLVVSLVLWVLVLSDVLAIHLRARTPHALAAAVFAPAVRPVLSAASRVARITERTGRLLAFVRPCRSRRPS